MRPVRAEGVVWAPASRYVMHPAETHDPSCGIGHGRRQPARCALLRPTAPPSRSRTASSTTRGAASRPPPARAGPGGLARLLRGVGDGGRPAPGPAHGHVRDARARGPGRTAAPRDRRCHRPRPGAFLGVAPGVSPQAVPRRRRDEPLRRPRPETTHPQVAPPTHHSAPENANGPRLPEGDGARRVVRSISARAVRARTRRPSPRGRRHRGRRRPRGSTSRARGPGSRSRPSRRWPAATSSRARTHPGRRRPAR